MKKILTLLMFSLLLTTACKKQENDSAGSAGYLTAQKDGAPWRSTTQSFNYAKPGVTDSIIIGGSVGEEHFSLRVKNAVGKYRANYIGGGYSVTLGGDVLLRQYQVVNDPGNDITITESNSNQVSGSFNVTMVSTYLYGYPNGYRGDTVRFKNGDFKVKLYQRGIQ